MIRTRRLRLVPATADLARADLEGRDALANALGVHVPDGWPPELYDEDATRYTLERLNDDPDSHGWWLYYFVLDQPPENPVLIGTGGFKGPPEEATVEVGYSIVRDYQRRGFATEATLALVRHAFDHTDVSHVIAETLPELMPSIGVLEKCGFTYAGPGSEDGVRRYVLRRSDFASGGIGDDASLGLGDAESGA